MGRRVGLWNVLSPPSALASVLIESPTIRKSRKPFACLTSGFLIESYSPGPPRPARHQTACGEALPGGETVNPIQAVSLVTHRKDTVDTKSDRQLFREVFPASRFGDCIRSKSAQPLQQAIHQQRKDHERERHILPVALGEKCEDREADARDRRRN
jgi:hypothetical protein